MFISLMPHLPPNTFPEGVAVAEISILPCSGIVMRQSTSTKLHLDLGDHYDLIGKRSCMLSSLSDLNFNCSSLMATHLSQMFSV